MKLSSVRLLALASAVAVLSGGFELRSEDFIPRAQTKPPGPARTPQEAVAAMDVPEGFSVEIVASEPDLVNPVSMTIDEQGRFWITESLEYPRREPGIGRDRVKVLEDTDSDGQVDKTTIFAEGLNIPSGIAVGHGGVWVANAPDILFMQDTDGDGKADKREVIVTGFGRDDTHELPNSLTWGPDGWLYGLNGVFNPSRIEYRGKVHEFTCAMFRIHPVTRDFEIFCEGTSNPWGITWDTEGSAFVSACVIDHLWHLTESGYYHRQGGPYPPYTWKMESIVKHKHQLAAYAGIHYFDSDVYPEEYCDKLYMGNIHGGCINVDRLERDGSTYVGSKDSDFMTANDAWFMPIVQKTGPDGNLYILDWYDRYHCYQDANRDPEGVDRLHGRLYRIRYKDSPRVQLNLAEETTEALIQRLHSRNIYLRETAQRILFERNSPEVRDALKVVILSEAAPRKARMHALWALLSCGKLEPSFHLAILEHEDPGYRAWGVRAAGNYGSVSEEIRKQVEAMADDPAADVKLQVAIAARKIEGIKPRELLLKVLAQAGDDTAIPHIVWQNLHPLLEGNGQEFTHYLEQPDVQASPAFKEIAARSVERLLGNQSELPAVTKLLTILIDNKYDEAANRSLSLVLSRVQNREISGQSLQVLKTALAPVIDTVLDQPDASTAVMAALLATAWKDPEATARVREIVTADDQNDEIRVQALTALVSAGDESILDVTAKLLAQPEQQSQRLLAEVLAGVGRIDSAQVGEQVLAAYAKMHPELQPKAIEMLTQRPSWSRMLVEQVQAGTVPAAAVNVNQLRKLLSSGDQELVELVTKQWGSIRSERNPQREEVIQEVKDLLAQKSGDPHRGQEVFRRVCAQCHKIYGEGHEVGPDITQIGRTSMDLLLSNVLDPSLVIGSVYQATSVRTVDGRVLTGIRVEDNEQRLSLKTQGGKIETIARDEIEEEQVSNLSMMPEELEKQLKPEELVDLFSFLSLDRPPSDPEAKQIPGFAPAKE